MLIKYSNKYQQQVLEVVDPKTGTSNQFVYDQETQKMVVAKEQSVAKVQDLKFFYKKDCPSHGTIYFAKNLINNKVYKYTVSLYDDLERVQCSCCDFQEGHAEELDPELYLDSDIVSDHSNNLPIRLVQSRFCPAYERMVIFTLDSQQNNATLKQLIFDVETEKFKPNNCNCLSCDIPASHRKADEFGQLQMTYARSHMDRFGRTLLCLAIDWYDRDNGEMSVFAAENGDIGRYRFNSELRCFELEQVFEVRVCRKYFNLKIQREKHRIIHFDDKVHVSYISFCPSQSENFFFATIQGTNGSVKKFRFNPVYMQLDQIKCSCCVYDPKKCLNTQKLVILGIYNSVNTQSPVVLIRKPNGSIEKRVKVTNEKQITFERAPIRVLKYEEERASKSRRDYEASIKMDSAKLFVDEDLIEYYRLWQFSKLFVDMQGRIFKAPHYDENARIVPKPEPFMDSELTPLRIGYCEHYKTAVIAATSTHGLGHFIFDVVAKEVREIHCCQVPRDVKQVSPLDFITISCDPVCPIFLKVDKSGNLVKQYYDNEREVFVGIPAREVKRTLKWREELELKISSENEEAEKKREIEEAQMKFLDDWEQHKEFFGCKTVHNTDNEDAESTATAKEPSEFGDMEDDAESTATALEPSDLEDSDDEEDSDAESTATALEPSDVDSDSDSSWSFVGSDCDN